MSMLLKIHVNFSFHVMRKKNHLKTHEFHIIIMVDIVFSDTYFFLDVLFKLVL